VKLIHGDCLEKLKEMEDNSVDSIVTDPPYGISFMGKKWDYDVPSVEVWKEVIRVLKPGGHALVACGTRTQHRMAVNLEDAGFEIRDIVAWIYGSGFPKSLNIAKSIESKIKTGSCAKNNFNQLEGERREGRIGMYDTVEEHGFRKKNPDQLGAFNLKATTPEAKEWEGWGTALKPAMELWTLCRKPLSEKTVAENCLKWGVGGINIDGCRVEGKEIVTTHSNGTGNTGDGGICGHFDKVETGNERTGRFPANLIHDGSDEVVEGFPNTKGGTAVRHNSGGKTFGGENEKPPMEDLGYNDSGSASRFFYTAKASKGERNKGLEGFEEKQTTGGGGLTANKKEDGSYETASAGGKYGSIKAKQTNNHPTVKPVELMRYLCRLITPPNGVILDPYMGSGTTGIGAKLEGFDFIGIEREEDYVKIAEARVDAWEVEEQLDFWGLSVNIT
jgi:DNA modification methylase